MSVRATVAIVLGLLGSLGVFVFGLKVMSEALQKVAGPWLNRLLARPPRSRLGAVGTGFAVTGVVQSSSATSVLVLGLVTAELLTLSQALGLLIGANVGTTLTGWLLALLGFRLDIASFALPAVGAGFAMGFLRGARVRQWGEVLLGFGLLFMGLEFLLQVLPEPGSVGRELWLDRLEAPGLLAIAAFAVIGAVVSTVLQSSSATLCLAMALGALGWLPYSLAAAMVLGLNVGTTATANLAAVGSAADAQRAARGHLAFNLVGLAWCLPLLQVAVLPAVDALLPGDPEGPLLAPVVAMHLALVHSGFNVVTALVLVPAQPWLERLVRAWVPEGPGTPEKQLRYLGTKTLIDTPELVLLTATREMQHMVRTTGQVLRDASHILTNPDEDLSELVTRTLAREETIDEHEEQIIRHLTLTARAATSASAARKIAEMVQNTHRLERIGDHCAALVRIAMRLRTSGQRLADEDLAQLRELAELVQGSLRTVDRHLAGEAVSHEAEELEQRIDQLRGSLRRDQVDRLKGGEKDLAVGLAYLDLLTHYEQIGDRSVGIIRHAQHTASL